jgi:peptidyl-tRNA hydrolase, PTH1 family
LADRAGERLRPAKALHAWVAEIRLSDARVALAVPTTYMNESGQAVRPLVARFGVEDIERLVIVHDELDLPPGKLKIKIGGGLAGHNGLRSIQSHLHTTDFVRVRIGVGKPPDPRRGADHVLKRPSAKERATIEASVSRAADAIEILAEAGVSDAMLWANTDQNDGR